jgi:colicin import membrane protein
MTPVAFPLPLAIDRLRQCSVRAVLVIGLGAGWMLAAGAASAAELQDAQAVANQQSRAELNAKRAAVQKAYDDKVKECHSRFVVTDCLEQAHTWRIEALRPILAQEKDVNALERQQRAAAQRQRVMAKGQEAASEASTHAPAPVKASPRPAPSTALPPSRAPRANPEEHQKQLQRQQAAAERKAAERRKAAADRLADQQEQQRRAKEMAEKRASKPVDPKKPKPAHLPTPSASDIQSLPTR